MSFATRLAFGAVVFVVAFASPSPGGTPSFAGGASASFTPRFIVNLNHSTLGDEGGVGFDIETGSRDDAAIAKATVFIPPGFTAKMNRKVGTAIGYAVAQARAADLAGATVAFEGRVEVADPDDYRVPPSNVCAPGLHGAVWLLVLTGAGQELRIPMYLDVASSPAASFASYTIEFCLPPPYVPPGTPGRAALGATFNVLFFAIGRVFTNPSRRGEYVFRAAFTPYAPSTGVANTGAAVESRSIHRLPGRLSLSEKLVRRVKIVNGKLVETYFANLSGALTENTVGIPASPVRVIGVGTVTTNASGRFNKAVRVVRTTYFTASAAVGEGYDRDFTPSGCAGPSIAPAGCLNATLGSFNATSRTVKVTVPKPKPQTRT